MNYHAVWRPQNELDFLHGVLSEIYSAGSQTLSYNRISGGVLKTRMSEIHPKSSNSVGWVMVQEVEFLTSAQVMLTLLVLDSYFENQPTEESIWKLRERELFKCFEHIQYFQSSPNHTLARRLKCLLVAKALRMHWEGGITISHSYWVAILSKPSMMAEDAAVGLGFLISVTKNGIPE